MRHGTCSESCRSSESKLRRAIELNPSYAYAHDQYGELLERQGRFDEALVEMRRASEHDASRVRNGAGLSRGYFLTTSAVGALATNWARRADQSALFTWSASTTPDIGSPSGSATSNGYSKTAWRRVEDDRKGFGLEYQGKVSRVSSVPSFGAPPTASSSLGTTVFCLQVSDRAFSCSKWSNRSRSSC